MKIYLFFLLVCLMVCCKDPADQYVKRFDRVDITKISIPDTAINQQRLWIRAMAQADNGCWSNLYFELKKTKEFEYTLTAYGTYESFGKCSTKIVTQDTVISFLPKQTGTYHFLIARESDKTEKDSVVIIE